MKKIATFLMLSLLLLSAFLVAVHIPVAVSSSVSAADYESAVIKVADRLVALQSPTDYG